ncbi:MAG: hypothetical protein GXP33_12330 [Spirochaetes bacterium]|nr:hypothetical protein [Spirochaetota bacterium]
MKKSVFLIIIVIFYSSVSIYTEDIKPQIAYRFLDGYIRAKEKNAELNKKIGAGISLATGGIFLGASAVTYFYGDEIYSTFDEMYSTFNGDKKTLDPNIKNIAAASFALGGLFAIGMGAAILVKKPVNLHKKYSFVFEEKDPVVQEALASAVLKDIAEEGERKRIISGFTSLATPLLSIGLTIGSNIINPKKEWYADILTVNSWFIGNIVSGISSFLSKSKEERLYEKYLAAKKAIYESE